MRVNLAAVQPKMELSDYASVEAFGNKMNALMDRAARNFEGGHPALVVFPEYLGMYLSFVPRYWQIANAEGNFKGSVERIVREHSAATATPAGVRAAAQKLLFVDTALETEQAYLDIFSSLARRSRSYIVAGSLCVPETDESPHRGGRFLAGGTGVYNQSYLISPSGLCLQRTRKVNLPEGEEWLIDPAPHTGWEAAKTSIGRIGTALCFDGYHHSAIGSLDADGADIIAQPIYFPNPDIRFDGSGKFVPRPWDFISMVQGRENIQFVIAAGQTGAVFADQRAESLSFIARNTGRAGAPWESAVIARSESPYGEDIVSATVEVTI